MKNKKSDANKYTGCFMNLSTLYWYQKLYITIMFWLPKYQKEFKRFNKITIGLKNGGQNV